MYEMLQRLTWMRWTQSKVVKWRRERSIDWERLLEQVRQVAALIDFSKSFVALCLPRLPLPSPGIQKYQEKESV